MTNDAAPRYTDTLLDGRAYTRPSRALLQPMTSCCRQSYAGYLPLDAATTLIQRDDNYDWLQIELLFKRGTDVSKNALERLANERMNPNSRELKVGTGLPAPGGVSVVVNLQLGLTPPKSPPPR